MLPRTTRGVQIHDTVEILDYQIRRGGPEFLTTFREVSNTYRFGIGCHPRSPRGSLETLSRCRLSPLVPVS